MIWATGQPLFNDSNWAGWCTRSLLYAAYVLLVGVCMCVCLLEKLAIALWSLVSSRVAGLA